jgi:hypothetical protein
MMGFRMKIFILVLFIFCSKIVSDSNESLKILSNREWYSTLKEEMTGVCFNLVRSENNYNLITNNIGWYGVLENIQIRCGRNRCKVFYFMHGKNELMLVVDVINKEKVFVTYSKEEKNIKPGFRNVQNFIPEKVYYIPDKGTLFKSCIVRKQLK